MVPLSYGSYYILMTMIFIFLSFSLYGIRTVLRLGFRLIFLALVFALSALCDIRPILTSSKCEVRLSLFISFHNDRSVLSNRQSIVFCEALVAGIYSLITKPFFGPHTLSVACQSFLDCPLHLIESFWSIVIFWGCKTITKKLWWFNGCLHTKRFSCPFGLFSKACYELDYD